MGPVSLGSECSVTALIFVVGTFPESTKKDLTERCMEHWFIADNKA